MKIEEKDVERKTQSLFLNIKHFGKIVKGSKHVYAE